MKTASVEMRFWQRSDFKRQLKDIVSALQGELCSLQKTPLEYLETTEFFENSEKSQATPDNFLQIVDYQLELEFWKNHFGIRLIRKGNAVTSPELLQVQILPFTWKLLITFLITQAVGGNVGKLNSFGVLGLTFHISESHPTSNLPVSAP